MRIVPEDATRAARPARRRRAPASSTCSAATQRRTPASRRALAELDDPALARGGRADDRARGRRPLPGRVRRDGRLGGARGRGGARRSATGRSSPRRSACAPSRRALSGVIPEARAHRDEAAALIDELSDDELARRLDALVHLATAEMYLDQFEASGRHAERALAIGRAHRAGRSLPADRPDAGHGAVDAGPHGGVRGGVRRRRRGRAAGGQRAGRSPGTSSTARSRRSRPETSRSALATAEESVEICARASTRASLSAPRGLGTGAARCSRPAAPSRRPTCS